MNSQTLRIVFAIFLVLHGLIAMSLATVPVPQPGALRTPYLPAWWHPNVDSAWPISRWGLSENLVRMIGWVLWLASLLLLNAAAIGLLGLPGLSTSWQILAVIGSALSLLLLGLYWHPWLIAGVAINIGILAGVYFGWLDRWLGFSPI
jgi:hypothetical protein